MGATVIFLADLSSFFQTSVMNPLILMVYHTTDLNLRIINVIRQAVDIKGSNRLSFITNRNL